MCRMETNRLRKVTLYITAVNICCDDSDYVVIIYNECEIYRFNLHILLKNYFWIQR